jgi:broad specificity phosphatase PhoE
MRLRIERDLHEVRRPWVGEGNYRDHALAYLRGEPQPGWETRDEATRRMSGAVDRLLAARGDVALVSHGLALTLLVGSLLELQPAELPDLWARIQFPDLAVIDVDGRRIERDFGARSRAE